MDSIIEKTTAYVKDFMSNYDASHDFAHIQRVLKLAKTIEASERGTSPDRNLDGDIITLAALLHDVGDRKYLKPGEDSTTLVSNFLKTIGTPSDKADKIQLICSNVSYSNEMRNTSQVAQLCTDILELAIVQDADRLDAIGAVGVARMFCFTGAKSPERGLSVEHFYEKLLRLEEMMKTETGKSLARERTKRMETYLEWWGDEVGEFENHVNGFVNGSA